MPKYRVLKTGFYGTVLRVPGGKHDPVVTSKPIPKKELPSWLELIKDDGKVKNEVTEPNDTVDSFMGDEDGVKTL
jgi:hypothetical protein